VTIQDYFSSGAITTAVAVLVAGLTTALTTRSNENKSAFNLGLALSYCPLAYAAGGALVLLGAHGSPVAYAAGALLVCISLHLHYGLALLRQRGCVAELQKLKGDYENLQGRLQPYNEMVSSLSALRAIDIESAFSNCASPAFLAHLRGSIAASQRIALLLPHPESLFASNHGDEPELAHILRDASRKGHELVIVYAAGEDIEEQTLGLTAGHARLVPVSVDLMPESLLVLMAGNIVYFSVHPVGVSWQATPIVVGTALEHGTSSFAAVVRKLVLDLISGEDPSSTHARVTLCDSSNLYHRLIVDLERSAHRIDRIPKRISVLFKDDEVIEYIARSRFGTGNPTSESYTREHITRRELFYASLRNGQLNCRELYNMHELRKYGNELTHSGPVRIPAHLARGMVARWRDCIHNWPERYMVGLTTSPIPLKYQIIDSQHVVFHEAVGSRDLHRMNAFGISSRSTARRFEADFNTVWSDIEPQHRDPQFVADWILKNVVPTDV
jgi:hypothetical protein